MEFEFTNKFDFISGKKLDLRIIAKQIGNSIEIPYYWYAIYIHNEKVEIGRISIRIGNNFHSYYNGHIGYEINEEYRGHNYAYEASLMVIKIAKYHQMNRLILTCDDTNIASFKIIEHLGGRLIEVIHPPKEYFGYYEGIELQRIYELKI